MPYILQATVMRFSVFVEQVYAQLSIEIWKDSFKGSRVKGI